MLRVAPFCKFVHIEVTTFLIFESSIYATAPGCQITGYIPSSLTAIFKGEDSGGWKLDIEILLQSSTSLWGDYQHATIRNPLYPADF